MEDITNYKLKYDELILQKKNQDDLIREVNSNLTKMRQEREVLNSEIS